MTAVTSVLFGVDTHLGGRRAIRAEHQRVRRLDRAGWLHIPQIPDQPPFWLLHAVLWYYPQEQTDQKREDLLADLLSLGVKAA